MLKRTLTAGLLGLSLLAASQSASALSCMRPDLAKTMEEAKQSATTYHVLVGKFRTVNYKPRGPMDLQNQFKPRPPQITRAWFEGFSLGPNRRMDVPLRGFPVDMEISCSGPWCGGPPSADQTQIAFVEARRNAPPILRIHACPSNVFYTERGDGKVKKLRQCYKKSCQPDFEQPPRRGYR
jgi:hypothetical protein